MKYSCLPDHSSQGVITRVSTYLAAQIRRTTSTISVGGKTYKSNRVMQSIKKKFINFFVTTQLPLVSEALRP
jgi:hypothetical protein